MSIEIKNLLIADDHPIFRQGIKLILETVEWINVVGEADSGDSALMQTEYLKPDIIILDIAMPGMDGLSVLEKVKFIRPEIIVIIATSYDDKAYLDRALSLGAKAYIIKGGEREDIINCLNKVKIGEVYISPSMGSQNLQFPIVDSAKSNTIEKLTKTEKKILAKVANFLTSKEIAMDLNVSYRTVQNHRANICNKLDLKGSHQLMSFAREHLDVLDSYLKY